MNNKHLMTAIISSILLTLTGARPGLAQAEADESAFEGDVYEDEWVEQEAESQEAWAEPEAEVDVNFFFQQLAPFGEWLWTPEHGWVWRPNEVEADWQPYTNGNWVHTEHGWTWSSAYSWGWAPFHYGRWAFLDHVGWVWVPGTVWGPAWVVWRYSDTYVGWSPLLAGYGWWYGWSYYPVHYSHWTFTHWNHFCSHRSRHHYLPRGRVRDAFRHSYYPRRCRDAAGPGCSRGPARRAVERVARVQIPTVQTRNMAKSRPIQNLQAKPRKQPELGLKDDKLRIYRPRTETVSKGPEQLGRSTVTHRPNVDLGVVQRPSATRPVTPSTGGVSGQAASRTDGPVSEIRFPSRRPSQGATIHPRRPPRSGVGSGASRSFQPATRPKASRQAPALRPNTTRPSPSPKAQSRPNARPGRSLNRPSSPSKSSGSLRPSSSRSPSRSSGSKGSSRSGGSSKSSSSSKGGSSKSSSGGSSRSRHR